MAPLILTLVAGIVIGIGLRRRARLLLSAERATTVSIYVLLFLLGLSVGTNDDILQNLVSLGLEALVLSTAGTGGSVVLVYVLYRGLVR